MRSSNQIAFNNYGTVSRTNITANSSTVNIFGGNNQPITLNREISDVSITVGGTVGPLNKSFTAKTRP